MKGHTFRIVCSVSSCLCPVIIVEHIEPFSEPLQTHEILMSRISFYFFYCQIRGYSRVVSSTPPTTDLLLLSFVSTWIIISFFISPFVSFHCAAQMLGFLWIFFQDECVSRHLRQSYFDKSS